jgi:signal transduction histidine kinase
LGIYKYQKNKRTQLRTQLALKDQLAQSQTQNKLQEQRLRISRDLHDNIGSQLTFIISSIDNLKFLTKASDNKLKGKLSDINSFATSTISQLRDTIWAMNKNEISYEDFYGRLLTFIEKAKMVKTDIKFNLSNSINSTPTFSSVEGINIFRVIQESLNNAIKYADASKIEIQLSENEKNILVSVQDNGVGFNINDIEMGNGLNNMQARISEIEGQFNLNSTPNKGTQIQFSISKNTQNAV